MDYLPSAADVAVLTVHLAYRYADEKHTNLTRFRVSNRSLRKIAGRSHLREAFLEEWAAALAEMGWMVIWHGDNNALIRTAAIDGWARISSKRIAADLDGINASKVQRFRRQLRSHKFL
jgi:hypothetical protein